jgi:hypothetical protein
MTKMCHDIGLRISPHGKENNESWVQLNNPSYKIRLEALENRFAQKYSYYSISNMLQLFQADFDFNKNKIKNKDHFEKIVFSSATRLYANSRHFNYTPLLKTLNESEFYYYKSDHGFRGAMLLPSVWVEVLSDKNYYLPLIKLAQNLYQEVKSNKTLGSKRNFHNDLIQTFLDAGIKKEKAVVMSWNVLGLYGSQGAWLDTFSTYFDKHFGLGHALGVIGYAISIMDTLTEGDHIYSIPSQIKTSCKIGKPYHYWMSAYLAYQLKNKHNLSVKKSIRAPFNLGKYYEYYSGTNGREGGSGSHYIEHYLRDGSLAKGNLSQRLGMVLHAAGSFYGAHYPELPFELNIENMLKASIESAKSPLFYTKNHSNIPMRTINLDRIFGVESILKQVL